MNELVIAFEAGEDEMLRPREGNRAAEQLAPLRALGAEVMVALRPRPEHTVGSFLPELQAVVATLPWAAVAGASASVAKAVAAVASEWIRAGSQRSVRLTLRDGREIEIRGRDVDAQQLQQLLAAGTDNPTVGPAGDDAA